MIKTTPPVLSLLRWAVIGALLVSAGLNQFNFSLKPFFLARKDIPAMISRNDTEKLQVLAPDLFALIRAVNAFPPQTRFYFMPCFQDSGNTGRWWWYVFVLTRYFAYPRIILSHNASLRYTKENFIARYIGKARTYQDLDWIKSKNIQVIILMRNNKVEFLGVDTPIEGL
jgi:hypothetical protein